MAGSNDHPDFNLSAKAITRRSGSNLTLAFLTLPRRKRQDMRVLYAFCRLADDVADSPTLDHAERVRLLGTLRAMVDQPPPPDAPPVARELDDLIRRRQLDRAHFHALLDGVAQDLDHSAFMTFDDLRLYCHRVASAVGLLSIEIFGYTDPRCRQYAENLGLALQLTNILRDAAEDFTTNGRVYIPAEDFTRFQTTPSDLGRGNPPSPALRDLLAFQAARARSFFQSARDSLPPADRQAMRPAETMRLAYSALLGKIESADFHILERRVRLSPLEKILLLLGNA